MDILLFIIACLVGGATFAIGALLLASLLFRLAEVFGYVYLVCLLLMGLTLLTGCSTWQEMPTHEKAFHVMNVVDTGQTIHIAREPGCYREVGVPTRALIGEHPSERDVYLTMAAYSLAYHYARKWLDARVEAAPSGSQERGWWIVGRATLFGGLLIGKAATIANNADIELEPWGRGCY